MKWRLSAKCRFIQGGRQNFKVSRSIAFTEWRQISTWTPRNMVVDDVLLLLWQSLISRTVAALRSDWTCRTAPPATSSGRYRLYRATAPFGAVSLAAHSHTNWLHPDRGSHHLRRSSRRIKRCLLRLFRWIASRIAERRAYQSNGGGEAG